MVSCLQKIDLSISNQINDTVLSGQSAGPCAWGQIFQWLWFSDALKWVAQDIFYHVQCIQCQLSVGFYPIAQIFNELWLKYCQALFSSQDQPLA